MKAMIKCPGCTWTAIAEEIYVEWMESRYDATKAAAKDMSDLVEQLMEEKALAEIADGQK